jgi:hypothetical protein
MHTTVADIFEQRSAILGHAQTEAVEFSREARSQGGDRQAANRWRKPFSIKEVVLSSICLMVFCAALVGLLSHYPYYDCCYAQISAAIRQWDFRGLDPSQPKEFWGFSYLSALVASVTRLPDDFAIVLVSSSTFVLANYLCCRLWGTTVAAWFMVVSWWWLDVGTEGMNEPLFMALLLGSFIAFRKERWVVAAVLASGATVVRPVGIFGLAAIGVVLFARRDWRRLAITAAIGLTTGVLYVLPMIRIYGDPLANVRGYHTRDWSSTMPVTIPLLPEIKGALIASARMKGDHGLRFAELSTLQILIGLWVLLTLGAIVKMAVDKRFWYYSKLHPAEAIFAGAYAAFLYSYNTPYWAWQHFPRFVIPLLPFLLLVFLNRLPRDRRIVWGIALLNIVISIGPKVRAIHPFPQ